MRVVLCGGGTGGHVYPALAVAAALSEMSGADGMEFLYIGTEAGPEAGLVKRAGLPFYAVKAAGIRGRTPVSMVVGISEMAVGAFQARRALADFRPQAVLTTGGYVSVPVAAAARLRNTPLVVYLPDVRPGWAVQYVSRLAGKVAVTSQQALSYLPAGKVVVTGYPVRPGFFELERSEARRRLGLGAEGLVLLVSGGSRGAHRLNQAVAERLPELLEHCSLLHVCGVDDEERMKERAGSLPEGLVARYRLFPYMYDEMPLAMASSDLAVLRSGASVMGELPAAGLPAILVPYPHAGGHQRYNAQYMRRQGAVVVLEESDIHNLIALTLELLSDEPRRQAMRARLSSLARPNAAREIARLVLEAAA